MSLLDVDRQDTICIVSGESIVIEAAIAASEGTIIAVEPNAGSMRAMEENAAKFGVHNVEIVGDLEEDTRNPLPTPRLAFIVADKQLEENIQAMLQWNPNMQFVIYTLELTTLASIPPMFERYAIGNMEAMQIAVSKTNHNNVLVAQPSPWLITGEAQG
jgi:precorrin-6Y C5,15-methyltransferase (decarboxylating)